uniref:MADF domain-containing protein n=1 Tax=Anopheles atroparvus TaxID=41427 RepID=A0A182IXA8_ANOAO
MSSVEWKREAVEHLIQAYRMHPVLFNMRHPRYYNKGSRSEALNQILEEVHSIRPETTVQDVLRKIQTLRTQFGQEIAKSRRASKHGMTYNPTAWWFKGLSFLQNHIKHRSLSPSKNEPDESWKRNDDDNSFNISIVQGDQTEVETAIINEYDQSMDATEYHTEVHYEIDPIDTKNIKTVELKAVQSNVRNNKQLNGGNKKSELDSSAPYQLNQTPVSLPAIGTVVELAQKKEQSPLERHVSLGNFVASQMAHIKDDYNFFATQMEVLNVINRGILKQLASDKNAASEATSGGRSTNRLCDEIE